LIEHFDFNLWVRAPERGQSRPKKLLHRRRNIPNAQAITFPTDQTSNFRDNQVVIGQQAFGFLGQSVPAVRGSYASGGPFQHPSAKVVFKLLYLASNRGLGNVQALGGAAKAAFLKDNQEQSELFDHGRKRDAKTASPQSPIAIICSPIIRTLRSYTKV
jgi:hypothetical protein